MNQDFSERELDELMAMFQDNPHWHAKSLVKAIPYLVSEIRRRRGTNGPTNERDRRIDYRKVNNGNRSYNNRR